MSHGKMIWSVLLVGALVGCDYRPFKYEAAGQLRFPNQQPAAGVTLIPDSSQKPSPPPSTSKSAPGELPPDYVAKYCTVTDSNGRFTAKWIGDDMYSGINIIFPPAPMLGHIYVWIKDGSAWRLIRIAPDARCQLHPFPGGRRIDLPPIVLPVAVTNDGRSP